MQNDIVKSSTVAAAAPAPTPDSAVEAKQPAPDQVTPPTDVVTTSNVPKEDNGTVAVEPGKKETAAAPQEQAVEQPAKSKKHSSGVSGVIICAVLVCGGLIGLAVYMTL